MIRALLIGKEPGLELGYQYVAEPPYDVVVIGSLSLGGLLRFREERVLTALAEGKSVYLYTPGLPESPKNRVKNTFFHLISHHLLQNTSRNQTLKSKIKIS